MQYSGKGWHSWTKEIIMSAATLTIQATGAATLPFGSFTFGPITVAGSITPSITSLTLASGLNTIPVPGNTVGVIISPPIGNALALRAKTTSGDAGINIPPAAPSVVLFDTANRPSDLFIDAADDTTGLTQISFF
jgi:hypothetical protein